MESKFRLSKKRITFIFNDLIYFIPINFIYISNNNFFIYELLTDVNDIKNINYGGFSIVLIYNLILNKNKKISLKIYRNNDTRELEFYKRINYKDDLNSKYICYYYGNFSEIYQDIKFNYLFLEFMKYDFYDLMFKHKKELYKNYDDIINIFRSIYLAIKLIHSKNYIYNDLKLENVMINDKNEIKIIDFNCILKNNSKIKPGIVGTIDYLAPEAFENDNKLCFKSDLWSFGILLYELLTKKAFPYIDKNKKKTINNIKNNIFNDREYADNFIKLQIKKYVNLNLTNKQINFLSNIFVNCLRTNPNKRIINLE